MVTPDAGLGVDANALARALDKSSKKWDLVNMGHTRHLTDQLVISAVKIARDLNLADVGTHYSSREVLASFERLLRNA